MNRHLHIFPSLAAVLMASMPHAQTTLDELHSGFLNPPDDSRIMMRWWWFGPAVTKPELKQELETMKAGGIGGVEIQLLEEFRNRRGYDLTPYLPALVADIGPSTMDIRYDWARTLTELVNENYLTPITQWTHAHQTQFRSQTYGVPAVTLSSNNLVDLPEGEGSQWRSFSYTRWATSANHIYGRSITYTETWTWLHSPSFRATPLDMKA